MGGEELRVHYTADASDVVREHGRVDRSLASMDKGVQSFGQRINAMGARLTSFGAQAGQMGRNLTVGLTLPVVAFGMKSVQAFRESQAAGAATEAVIRSTGAAAGVTAGQVGGLASSLGKLTAFENDAIQAGTNLLLTFTNIKNQAGAGNDILSRATSTMLDMSQALGQDLSSSAIQLGKALNDPIAGATALRRVGVQLTDQQESQIAKFMKSGDVLSAQKVILNELATEFGGAAAAFAKTDAGKQAQEMNRLGDAMEKIGAAIGPIVSRVAGFIARLATAFTGLSPGMQNAVLIAVALAAALGPVITVIGAVATAVGFLLSPVGLVVVAIAALIAIGILVWRHWDTIAAALKRVWEGISSALSATWAGLKGAAIAVFNFLKMLFLNFTPIGQIIQHWQTIKDVLASLWNVLATLAKAAASLMIIPFSLAFVALRFIITTIWGAIGHYLVTAWTFIASVASTVWNAITGFISAAVNVVRSVVTTVWNAIAGFLSGVWSGIRSTASSVWNAIVGVISGPVNTIRGVVTSVANTIRSVLGAAWDAIKSGASSAWDAVVGAFRSAYNTIAGIVSKLKATFCNLPFVPCSPIPLVVDANATVAGVVKAFKALQRLELPAEPGIAAGGGGRAPTSGGGRAPTSGAEAVRRPPRGAERAVEKHYHLHVPAGSPQGQVVAGFNLVRQLEGARR